MMLCNLPSILSPLAKGLNTKASHNPWWNQNHERRSEMPWRNRHLGM